MAQFGPATQNVQISTGNVRTTIDSFQVGLTTPYNINGARNQLGATYYDGGVSTAANPNGVGTKYKYVRYLSTSNPTLTGVNGPFPVYWTDAAFTTVSPVASESVTGGLNMLAGVAMPNLTANPLMTAATLTAALNGTGTGSFIWIAVGGFVSGITSPTGAVLDDAIIGSATAFKPGRVATGTAPTNRVLGYAVTAIGTPAAGLCNALLSLES